MTTGMSGPAWMHAFSICCLAILQKLHSSTCLVPLHTVVHPQHVFAHGQLPHSQAIVQLACQPCIAMMNQIGSTSY